MFHTVKSFVGEATGYSNDPVKQAVQNATKLADQYFEKEDTDDSTTITVLSTTTQIIEHGDYFSYIITFVLKVEILDEEEEAQ